MAAAGTTSRIQFNRQLHRLVAQQQVGTQSDTTGPRTQGFDRDFITCSILDKQILQSQQKNCQVFFHRLS